MYLDITYVQTHSKSYAPRKIKTKHIAKVMHSEKSKQIVILDGVSNK
jgi:hypothetical protein